MKFFNLFGKRKASGSAKHFDPVSPDAPFCVIGDIHGRLDLLEQLVPALPKDTYIISVGDMIDRGNHSAQVLEYVRAHPEMTALMGNHEAMMLDFLIEPESHGRRWITNGGQQTLTSFGVGDAVEDLDDATLVTLRNNLINAMGDDLIQWLTGLECMACSGNVVIAHAGANPNQALSDHTPNTFIWGHPDFSRKQRTDGIWVVHGHTIVESPKIKDGRISIDTGAYATGQLTAAIFCKDGVEFVST
jgi:serine/threonine protein phosphatase 1